MASLKLRNKLLTTTFLFSILLANSSFAIECSIGAVTEEETTYTINTKVQSQNSISTAGVVIVNSGVQVEYTAPAVILEPGFQAKLGSQFIAVSSLEVKCSVLSLSFPEKKDISPPEGDENHVTDFLLEIDQALTHDVSADYVTVDGSAVANQDYVATSGTAIIKAGQTSTRVGVEIIGDKVVEANEDLFVSVSNPSGASFPEGIVEIKRSKTIVNDDFHTDNVVDTEVPADSQITVTTVLGDLTVGSSATSPTEIRIDDATDANGNSLVHIEIDSGEGVIELPPTAPFTEGDLFSGTATEELRADPYLIDKVIGRSTANYATVTVLGFLDILLEARVPQDKIAYLIDKEDDIFDLALFNIYGPVTAALLFSTCDYSTLKDKACTNQGKQPVLLIHGFQAELWGPEFFGTKNGGEEYWGDMPDKLLADGYWPFEFKWSTNARFQDVAIDLADAIDLIYKYTGKKVHVVAHSFGGILTRTLLQSIDPVTTTITNEAVGKIATITTVGTPHSGIANGDKTMHGVSFSQGQDWGGTDLFKFCQQLSCHLMGENVIGTTIAKAFDVSAAPGELAALLSDYGNLPDLNLQILLGFTLDYKLSINPYDPESEPQPIDFKVSPGDFLISGYGQRFDPALTNNDSWQALLSEAKKGSATVSEFILGRNADDDSRNGFIQEMEPMLALGTPGGLHTTETLLHYFTPFKHSRGSINDAFQSYWHSQEVCVGCGEEGSGYHDTLQRVLDWIKCSGEIQTDPDTGVVSCKTSPPIGISVLNDTGINWGGDYPDGNNATCTSNIAAPQDCDQGRDATHNDDSDGHAGFSFTKLDTNGNPLSASATNWSCVKDNVTGLVWEVKTDDGGIHDKDNTYRWGGKTALGSDYGTYYSDWDTLVDGANAESFCGFFDWRVPTRQELENIVSRDRYNPSIDTDYFPNTNSSHFWSSSPDANNSNYAWLVSFDYGYSVNGYVRDSSGHVRLVRSGQ